MFSNFIYLIIALLIYSTYQPAEEASVNSFESITLFIFLTGIFYAVTHIQFKRFQEQIDGGNVIVLDNRFGTLINRQSILALLMFAIDIYGLNLTVLFDDISIFTMLPTLQALVFLGIFIAYLCIIWGCSYASYRQLYSAEFSRKSYILSHVSFSIPVLLPWFLLSGISDLIHALPFKFPKEFLSTPEGEMLYFFFFLIAVAVTGPLLIQKFWGCKPLENGYMRFRIEQLCRRAGMEYSNILYWPIFGGRMITAGVMGLVKQFRYILVTDALLHFLRPEEIESVIAHEIGHVKKKHLVFYLIFFGGYIILSYAFFDLIIYTILSMESVYQFIALTGWGHARVISGLISIVLILLFVVYFRFIFGYFMRNFERQADTYVYSLFETAQPLISTFEKITLTSGQSPDKPNWHHFSITERVGYLQKCEADRRWINWHDRKVQKSIFIYLSAVLIIGFIGYHLNFGDAGKRLNQEFLEKIILKELEASPEKANLYALLGDLYYDNRKYNEVRLTYEKSLSLNPKNPHVLNNLAWLYATSEDPEIRNLERAIVLAQQASELLEEPHVLDTLAECYYVNGNYNEAVRAGERALNLAKKDREYFENQIKKFKNALKE